MVRLIGVGLAVSVVLGVSSGVASAWRAMVTRDNLDDLFIPSQASAQLLAEVGRDVARIRTSAVEQLGGVTPPRGVLSPSERRSLHVAQFDRDLARLETLLADRGHDENRGLRADLREFRATVGRFEEALAQGSGPDTGATYGELLVLAARIQSTIDTVLAESQANATHAVRLAEAELSRFAVVEGVLAILLVVGLVVVWFAVLGAQRGAIELLSRYVAKTEQANRDLDAFAGRLAHDFRNVLAPLPLVAERLRRPASVDPGRAAGQLDRVVQRGDRLIDGLLAFSRFGSTITERATPARLVVAEVVDELAPLAESCRARVETDVEDTEVACPQALVHLLLSNVLTNALKYLGDSPVRLVTLTVRRQDELVRFDVRDTGPGIAPEHLVQLFDPFFRVPGSGAEGTGLGLATVKRVVEAAGGSVELDSQPGRGTTVSLWLHGKAQTAVPARERPRPADTHVLQ